MEQRQVHAIVVPHTHWDRAWYLPFETFRHRLVRLIDRLIDLLDRDSAFTSFTLDGQTVLVDDYLEIRPERRPDLERLIRGGRLIVGPWYTAPDLFLPSGESLVRNLQIGISRSRELGGGNGFVGHAPDPFGHPAQMPQIMRGVGIDSYLFMRGMYDEWTVEAGSIFDWRAPDGSTVLAIYLREGYFAAGGLGLPHVFGRFDGLPADPELAARQIEETVNELAVLQEERTVLLLNGFDHMPEQVELPSLIEHASTRLENVDIRQGTLRGFVDAVQAEAREHVGFSGDLLGQADHPILASVWSTRMYLKRQNHEAERWLSGYAEPIIAAIGAPCETASLLKRAWQELLKNHAHDDICGCSVDAVHEDDEQRFRHVKQIAQALVTEQLESLLGAAEHAEDDDRTAELFVFNPLPFPVVRHVEVDVHFPIRGGEQGEPLPKLLPVVTVPDGGEIVPRVVAYAPRVMRTSYLEQTWASRYRIAFEAVLPPTGYHIYRVALESRTSAQPKLRAHDPVIRDGARLVVEDGAIIFEDRLRSHRIDALFTFEYMRDAGDTYSFSPVEGERPRIARLARVARVAEDTFHLTYKIDVPERLGSEVVITLAVEVDLRLGAGGVVSISGRYVNQARDGRLRIIIRSEIDTNAADADGQFLINQHLIPDAESPEDAPDKYAAYPGELPYTTHHQRDFVFVSDADRAVWIANRGLPEYEILREDGQASLAITLHRAIEYLSVVGGRIRRCGAGPHVPVPGAQCQREMTFELAIGTASADVASITRSALPHAQPPLVQEMPYLPYRRGMSRSQRSASLLEIGDPAVRLSALRPADDGGLYVLRVYNPTAERRRTMLTVAIPANRACETTLLEEWDEDRELPIHDGRTMLDFRPGEIKTLIFRR